MDSQLKQVPYVHDGKENSFRLFHLPREIITQICEWIDYDSDTCDLQYDSLRAIRALICSCKSFKFLKDFRFLVASDPGDYDIYIYSYNISGKLDGPVYIIYEQSDTLSGYIEYKDDKYKKGIHVDLTDNMRSFPIKIDGIIYHHYEYDDEDIGEILAEGYSIIHKRDPLLYDFIESFHKEDRSDKKRMIIRNSFPLIEYHIPQDMDLHQRKKIKL